VRLNAGTSDSESLRAEHKKGVWQIDVFTPSGRSSTSAIALATATFVAGLSARGMILLVLDGPINRLAFETHVEKVLVSEPRRIVITDNLSSHTGLRVRRLIQAADAVLRFLRPTDFGPIESAFAKLKALLRKAAERTVDGLWSVIGRLVDLITPAERGNYSAAAGYDAT